ncbi:MAG: glycosyltransferase, partial [Candidatus Sericytochromatia bacterium]|nr:glycosyltransferase [Candidatus Sericytochromatia bacterium]
YNTFPYSNNTLKSMFLSLPFFNNTNSFIYTWILEKRIKMADEITVSSSTLQRSYGGTFISSSSNEDLFDSDLYKRDEIRETMGWEDYIVILFAGKVNRDTDINLLINAVKEIDQPKLKLAIVGDNKIKNIDNQDKFYLNTFQPSQNIAKLLSACDLVVIPQNDTHSTFGKIPIKLYEAMSSSKIIIAPDTDDFSDILSDCGFTYKSGNLVSLKEAIVEATNDLELSNNLGTKAREKYLEKYSKKIMSQKLKSFFDKFEKKI